MSSFLLGMLVMWFMYPLLYIGRKVVTDKFHDYMETENGEIVDKTISMGFQLTGKV